MAHSIHSQMSGYNMWTYFKWAGEHEQILTTENVTISIPVTIRLHLEIIFEMEIQNKTRHKGERGREKYRRRN